VILASTASAFMRGVSEKQNRAEANAMPASSRGHIVVILRTVEAAIDGRSGRFRTTRVANDHAVVSRFSGEKCTICTMAAFDRDVIRGILRKDSVAQDQTKFAKQFGENYARLRAVSAGVGLRTK